MSRNKCVLPWLFAALMASSTAWSQVDTAFVSPPENGYPLITLHLAKTDLKTLVDTLKRGSGILVSYPVDLERYGPIRVQVDHASVDAVLSRALRGSGLRYFVFYSDRCSVVIFKPHSLLPKAWKYRALLSAYTTLPNDTLVSSYNNGFFKGESSGSVGSFETVGPQQMDRVVSSNVMDHFEGQVSGLTTGGPGNGVGFSVRGNSTLLGAGTPLMVLGPFPYFGNIGDINVYDLQSATVLKDAVAAGVWGAYSGNGVVELTPREGEYARRPVLTFTANTLVTQKPALSYLRQMSPASYIHADSMWVNSHFFDGYIDNSLFVSPPSVATMYSEQQGLVSTAAAAAAIAAMEGHSVITDLDRYYYRTAVMKEYHLSLEGGGPDNKYYVSGGYDNDPTVLVRNSYERYTLFGSYTARSENNKVEGGLTGGFSMVNSRNNNSGDVPVSYPYAMLADGAGHPLPVGYGVSVAFADTATGYPLDWHYRPLQELDLADNRSGRRNFWLQGSLRYQLLRNWGIELCGRLMSGHSFSRDQYNSNSFYVRDLVNSFSQPARRGYLLPVPDGNILDAADTNFYAYNVRGLVKYSGVNRKQGQWTMRAGAEISDVETQDKTRRLYGYDGIGSGSDLGSGVPMDLVDLFPMRPGGGISQIPSDISQAGLSDRALSLFANAAYCWRSGYNFYAAVRCDASNIVGVPRWQQWSPFWSVGVSRVFKFGGGRGSWGPGTGSREPVPAEASGREGVQINELVIANAGPGAGGVATDGGRWADQLKLRLTYGCNGNVSNRTAGLEITALGLNNYGAPQTAIVGTPDPSLSWERVYILDAGVDLEFLRGDGCAHGRFSGSVDVYQRWAVDLLSEVLLPPSSGVSSLYISNGAAITGQGIDLTLRSINVSYLRFRWTSTLLLGVNRDWISRYSLVSGSAQAYVTGGIMRRGDPSAALFSYRWAGLDPSSGNPQGLLAGKASEDYALLLSHGGWSYSGVWQPVLMGSLLNNFGVGRWNLSVRLDCRTGYVFRRPSVNYYAVAYGENRGYRDYDDRWQYPGEATQVPSQPVVPDPSRDAFYANSSVLIARADNIRFRDAMLSYGWTSRAGMLKSAVVYLYLNNIGLLWKANKYGLDPDAAGYGQLPAPRIYAVGGRFKF